MDQLQDEVEMAFVEKSPIKFNNIFMVQLRVELAFSLQSYAFFFAAFLKVDALHGEASSTRLVDGLENGGDVTTAQRCGIECEVIDRNV